MDELENKLGAILNDPGMMQQIMSMAQSMGGSAKQDAPPRPESSFPEIDMATIQKISALTQTSNIDKREQALLRALGAYLSKDRIGKLEKAMRAAKIAKIASSALGQRGALRSLGR